MKLALKNIKHSEHASHETNNFVADLYVNGKPFAVVGNDGQGGCDWHHKHEKNPQDYKEFQEQLQSLYKYYSENPEFRTECDFNEQGWYAGSLDSAVSDILVDHLVAKDVKKLMSRSIIVFEKGEKGYYKYGKKKYNIVKETMDAFRAKLDKWYGDKWVCLNDMPLDEAIAYYKAN